jgi:hypothetical protein
VTIKSAPSMPKAAPVVKKQVSTLEDAKKERYSDSELEEFRSLARAVCGGGQIASLLGRRP